MVDSIHRALQNVWGRFKDLLQKINSTLEVSEVQGLKSSFIYMKFKPKHIWALCFGLVFNIIPRTDMYYLFYNETESGGKRKSKGKAAQY